MYRSIQPPCVVPLRQEQLSFVLFPSESLRRVGFYQDFLLFFSALNQRRSFHGSLTIVGSIFHGDFPVHSLKQLFVV